MGRIEERIAETENRLHIVIPEVYREFLLSGSDMQFDDGILYDIDTIEERYTALGFAEYAPDLIPVGNDNGDYELVMRSGSKVTKLGFLEQGSIGTAKPAHMQDFAEWYKNGHSFSQEKTE